MSDGLFSDLDKLGLGMFSSMDLYAVEEKKGTNENQDEAVPVIVETDYLFNKGYKCPVCDTEFKAKAIRVGKVKLIGSDTDLRPKYQGVDSLKYDCVTCNMCGYSSLSRFFNNVTTAQIKNIKMNITPHFKGVDAKADVYSYEEAILRHQLALANTFVKKSKASEKAYTCLKIAWLLRGQGETLPEDTKDRVNVLNELKQKEKEYIKQAYEGFTIALSKELPPICGMDEWTCIYLVADLARQSEDYATAMKLLSDLIVSKAASTKLKDKAREMRKLMNGKS